MFESEFRRKNLHLTCYLIFHGFWPSVICEVPLKYTFFSLLVILLLWPQCQPTARAMLKNAQIHNKLLTYNLNHRLCCITQLFNKQRSRFSPVMLSRVNCQCEQPSIASWRAGPRRVSGVERMPALNLFWWALFDDECATNIITWLFTVQIDIRLRISIRIVNTVICWLLRVW